MRRDVHAQQVGKKMIASGVGIGIFLMALTMTSQSAPAASYVSKSGNHIPPYDSWQKAATNIAAAVDQDPADKLVMVTNGVYQPSGTIDLAQGIEVRSINGYAETTIRGNGQSTCVELSHADAVIEGFTITAGHSDTSGGGVFCNYGGIVRRCRITGNTADAKGGGVYCTHGGVLENCLINHNEILNEWSGKGAGVYCNNGGKLVNCTIVDNWIEYDFGEAGGLYCDGEAEIVNTIIVRNNAAYNPNLLPGSADITYSCASALTNGTGNITVSPSFVDADSANYRTTTNSPCRDAGVNGIWHPGDTDIEGAGRVVDGRVDMGAFEEMPNGLKGCPWQGFVPLEVIFESLIPVANTGTTHYAWDFDDDGNFDATFTNELSAIHTYTIPGDYSVTLTASNAVGEKTSSTYNNCVEVGPGNIFFSPAGGHIWPYDTWSTANTNLDSAVAMAKSGSTVWVTNGLHYLDATLEITNAITMRGQDRYDGAVLDGGDSLRCINLDNPNATIKRLTVQHGRANLGAGIYMNGGLVERCCVKSCVNTEDAEGGAIFVNGNGTVRDSLICDNRHVGEWNAFGAGIFLHEGGLVEYCTVVDNICDGAWGRCGGVYFQGGGACRYTIAYGNQAADGRQIPADSEHCYTNDPFFVAYEAGNYHLSSSSPCIDAATNSVPGDSRLALDGVTRFLGAHPDYGAYEYGPLSCGFTVAPSIGLKPLAVEFNATLGGNHAFDLYYQWDCDGDGLFDQEGEGLSTISNSYLAAGMYGAQLRVSNSIGEESFSILQDAVHVRPLQCDFEASPLAGVEPTNIVFTAVVDNPQGIDLDYRWDFENDGEIDLQGINRSTVTNLYDDFGLFSVALTVSNFFGELDTCVREELIDIEPAPLNCSFTVTPQDGQYPLTAVFEADIEGSFQETIWYQWDFERDWSIDIEGVGIPLVTNTYAQLGDYRARLTISNNVGESAWFEVGDITAFPPLVYVSQSGSSEWPYASWATAASTIQDACDCALDETTVIVDDGIYSIENSISVTNRVMLKSRNGPEATVVDANGNCRVFTLASTGIVVNGFTVREGSASDNPGGGGICCFQPARVENCIVVSNQAVDLAGGGMYGGIAFNTIFQDNLGNKGGAVAKTHLRNCTVYSNTATWWGGGMWGATATNTIFHMNESYAYSSDLDAYGAKCGYCSFLEVFDGEGNIVANPNFVDQNARDLRLAINSPCIDAGLNGVVLQDIRGLPRPLDGNDDNSAHADIGAYEFVSNTADSDGDGMDDVWELKYNLSPILDDANEDLDGDGASNIEEYWAKTGVNDTDSCFMFDDIAFQPGGEVVVQWQSSTGMLYNLYRSTNLLVNPVALKTNIPATPPLNIVTNKTASGTGPCFYRIEVHRGLPLAND